MHTREDQTAARSTTGWSNIHWLWLSALVMILDQLTKQLMLDQFDLYESRPLFPGLDLTLVHNTGAAFSMLQNATPWLFVALGIAVVVGVLFWMRRHRYEQRLLAMALSLVAGGALGNVIDRLSHGHVVDFIDFNIAGWHYPAFNIADCAIVIGAGLIILDMLLGNKRAVKN